MTLSHRLLILLYILLPLAASATAPKPPSRLRTSDKPHPVGTDQQPYFGWYVNDADANEIQTACQVLVSTTAAGLISGKADVWDSGKILSRRQNYVYYAGKPLLAATRYYWKVRTWDKGGAQGAWSAVSWFDTGLFSSADWSGAKWVKRDSRDPDDYTYYRKTITPGTKTIKRAIAYLAVGHTYEFFVNGKPVGKGASFHYPQYAYYQAYDISAGIKPGTPVTFAALTHWYGGGQGRAPGSRGFLAKIVVEYTDGSRTITGTDAGWKQKQAACWVTGQRQRGGEGVGYIERIDSRNFLPGWNLPAFNDTAWDAAVEIGSPPVEPWTGDLQPDLTRPIEREIKPVSVKKVAGNYVVDLGKVYAGMPKITFTGGTPGDVVSIHGAYLLNDDGSVNQRSNQSTNLDYFFILNGKKTVFEPMVYFGYRYLVIRNSPNVLTAENVRFVTTHYELDASRAGFTSSNPVLNQVWQLMARTLIEGTHEDFLDTPTREKGSFLGDAGYQGPPAMTTFGDRTMNLRTLLEFLDSQDQYWPDGRLNAVYPNSDGKRDIPDYTQAFLIWIWDYYLQTGNKAFLRDNYAKLKKIADYVDNYRNPSTGLIDKLAGGSGGYAFGIIDWPASMRYGYDMTPESRTVIDVYAYLDFDYVSRIAAVLGNTADQETYHAKALAMKAAINSKLIGQNGMYVDGLRADGSQSTHASQHANAFALAADIVPGKNQGTVINTVKEQKMSMGMVSVRMLPEALGRANEGPHLLELYTNASWDGWARTVSLGGTMTWEDWNSNTSGNSMSHPWGAIGLLGIQQYVLGVTVLEPQHDLVQIKPLDFKGKLASAAGKLPTDKGDIAVSWNRSATTFTLTLTSPVNVAAKVYVPKGTKTGNRVTVDGVTVQATEEGEYLLVGTIGSGKHTITR
ncbi:family 78 glycoside hydrolase catalytic domain [Hufsiella ginkgonis]|uniref:alpha-L-rhamnosidase n=1 Tax=Hufsiella ginkgonis TaxID=2695274 RepID=A0A7K1XVH7_9SPHI|nr:family 78 glycoside hydrolase catalytic domain [Hufsiella ginkgonis]MXV14769.1 family 78 glycoside hydrolase catalytic domain [Hufsiella ginkgonis]